MKHCNGKVIGNDIKIGKFVILKLRKDFSSPHCIFDA